MILDPDLTLRAAGAFAAVLLPLLLALRLLRGRGRGMRGHAVRRLALEDALALDARRRLLLVRCDDRALLLLTGSGQDVVIGWLPEPPVP